MFTMLLMKTDPLAEKSVLGFFDGVTELVKHTQFSHLVQHALQCIVAHLCGERGNEGLGLVCGIAGEGAYTND
jgi:hypothetical protein